jgi:hypothetical protein
MSEDSPQPQPSTTAANGDRGPGGKFAPGNKAAKGNPFARKAAQLRSALFRAVSATDLRAIVKSLVADAKTGDTTAAKLVLAYTLGDPQPADLISRLENLEAALEGRQL